jgi:uncharacterized protein (DUF2249 family)
MMSVSLQVHPFDARGISRRFRHAAIFGALEALHPGDAMRFVNDHDPLPLLAQLQERYGELLSVDYRQREPGAVVIDFALAPTVNSGNDDSCCGSCG